LSNKISRYKKIEEQLKTLRAKQKGLSEGDFRTAVESEAQGKMLKVLKLRNKRGKEKVEENRQAIKNTQKELGEAEMLYEALSPQGISALQAKDVGERIATELGEYFPDREIEVSTVRANKTNDNFREVFDITVDGIHYTDLSFGERILMGVVLSLFLRKCVGDFPFNFMLLDEASVLSETTLDTILDKVQSEGLNLIYTKASNEELNLKVMENGRD